MERLHKTFIAVLIVIAQHGFPQSQFSGLFSATSSFSQLKFDERPITKHPDYKNAIGIRAGGTSGITYKHFFENYNAFEVILGIWPNAFGFTGLYEKHAPTGLSGLKFYYGGGGHIIGETVNYYNNRDYYGEGYRYRHDRNGFGAGIDGILGIDYKIPVIPFSISLDLKPLIEINNAGNIFTAIDPGLGIKVAF